MRGTIPMAEGRAPRGGWSAVAAGFVVLFVGSGVNFAFGILFKPILLELGSERSTLALVSLSTFGVPSPTLDARAG